MSDREIEALVKTEFPWLEDRRLDVSSVDDHPELRYVAVLDDEGEPLFGGAAYVVSLDAQRVVEVPATLPTSVSVEQAIGQIYMQEGGPEAVS